MLNGQISNFQKASCLIISIFTQNIYSFKIKSLTLLSKICKISNKLNNVAIVFLYLKNVFRKIKHKFIQIVNTNDIMSFQH